MSFIKRLVRKGLRHKSAYRLVKHLGLYHIKGVRRSVVFPGPMSVKNTHINILAGIHSSFNDLYYLGVENQSDSFTLDVVKKLSEQATTLWDIGAYIGLDALIASDANPNLNIVAFEPSPGNFSLVEKNLALNGPRASKINALPYGLGEESGYQDFYFDETKPLMGSLMPVEGFKRQRVEVYTGDFLITSKGINQPDLIKIDVEGYEAQVLSGFKEMLKSRPILIVEVLSEENGKLVEKVLPSEYVYFGILEETRELVKKDRLVRLNKRSKNYLILHQSRASEVLNIIHAS